MADTIQRELPPIDERLPFATFMNLACQQAASVQQEIVEDGVTYELADCKMKIKGYLNSSILIYRRKA